MKFSYYNKSVFAHVYKKISELINNGRDTFIIYPCGNVSDMVKNIVYQLHGNIDFYIDNYKNNGTDIFSISESVTRKIENDVILICSNNIQLYDEIRNNIYNYFPKEKVVDLFPEKVIDDCILASDDKLISDIRYFNSFLNEAENDESEK